MGLYSLRIAKDYAHEVIETLGFQSALQFIDGKDKSEKQAPLPYFEIVRKCDDMYKIIAYLEKLCDKFHIPLREPIKTISFLRSVQSEMISKGKNPASYFEETAQFLRDVNTFIASQQDESKQALEQYEILREQEAIYKTLLQNISSGIDNRATNIVKIAVSINKVDDLRFKRLIFRKTRGNSVISTQEMEDFKSKNLYVIVLRGEELKVSLIKACESFNKNV